MELFLQRLPTSVQSILAAVTDLKVDKGAEIAYKIIEVNPSPVETFSVARCAENSLDNKLLKEIERLHQRIDDISFPRGRSPFRRNKAICTPFGLFESTRMQFGLCNASSPFQRFIDEVTPDLSGVYAFVDDILIASETPDEHVQHLPALLSKLQDYGLCINAYPVRLFLNSSEDKSLSTSTTFHILVLPLQQNLFENDMSGPK
ncbi:hypothetical protein JTE90_010006 [Oedothorax gibbosus]|uniref:Reverse transcriptase domain-containing protein n=1 Tax=Oedothorax gibbosus TaxID=931172 RepID=A0AAV6TRT9_9ARAC|nr:hypothetical protein JTE90_010006 [Oedothorax gibbosus]